MQAVLNSHACFLFLKNICILTRFLSSGEAQNTFLVQRWKQNIKKSVWRARGVPSYLILLQASTAQR